MFFVKIITFTLQNCRDDNKYQKHTHTKKQQQQNREHKTTYIKGQEQRFDQVSHIQGIYTSMVPRVFE